MMKHTTSSTPNNHRQPQPPRHALHHSRHLFGICTRSTSILTPRVLQHHATATHVPPQTRIKRAVLGVTTMAFVAIMFRQTTVWSHAFYHRLFTPLVVDVDVDVEVDPTSYQQHQQQQPLFHLVISNAGPDETLSRLNLRCIESIFYFHPHAHVLLHTNHEKGLRSGNQHPQLAPLIHRGYHLEVRPYRPEQMLQAAMHYSSSLQQNHHHQRYNIDTTLATAFLANLSTLQQEKYWYANEANLVRLCVLYLHGGMYVDTDVIFLNHRLATLPLANAMSRHRDGTKFHNAVMKFQAANPFLSATLNTMMRHFNGTKWGNNGPKAFGRTAQQFPALICSPLDTIDIDNYYIDNNNNPPKNRDVTTTSTSTANNNNTSCWVHPLPNEAVAPVSYKDWHKVCFAETAPTYQQAKHLLRNSMVVHLNNKVTGKDLDRQAYRPDSLCHYVLTNYCVLCHE